MGSAALSRGCCGPSSKRESALVNQSASMERSPDRKVDLSMVSKGGLDHFSKEELMMMKRFRTLESRDEKPNHLVNEQPIRMNVKSPKESRPKTDPEGSGLSKE